VDLDDRTSLASSSVQSDDGQVIGRINAFYVDEGSMTARLVEVAVDNRNEHLIVPLGDAALTDGGLVLQYSADDIERGPTAEPNQVLSVGEIAAVVDYYQCGDVDYGGYSITDRAAIDNVPTEDQDEKVTFEKKNLPPIVRWAEPENYGA
jgi:hypothetical protein